MGTSYKTKYDALQMAIKFEIESLESRIDELKKRWEALDEETRVTIFQACDKGMLTAYEIELESIKRWVKE